MDEHTITANDILRLLNNLIQTFLFIHTSIANFSDVGCHIFDERFQYELEHALRTSASLTYLQRHSTSNNVN